MSNENIYHTEQKHQRIVWTDSWLVGNHSIDEQHKTIIDLINLFFDADYSRIQKKVTLPLAMNYMKNHLDAEEKLLEKSSYPELSGHKKIHDVLRKKIDKYLEGIEENNKNTGEHVDNYFEDFDSEIIEFFQGWWQEHIIIEDMKYSKYL